MEESGRGPGLVSLPRCLARGAGVAFGVEVDELDSGGRLVGLSASGLTTGGGVWSGEVPEFESAGEVVGLRRAEGKTRSLHGYS